MWKGRKPIQPTPYWYNTPFEDLDFEWSREEELEIERYCEKILKNIAEEGGMTPKERFNAMLWGKDKDRMATTLLGGTTGVSRAYDGYREAMKPIDLYQYPKLWVKGNIAFLARFSVDVGNYHAINYGEDLWGGQSKMIEYGNPVMEGKPPIETMEDLEGVEIPDPLKDGLYPGYIWAYREIKRIFTKYNVPHPIWGSLCVGPVLMPMMAMLGMEKFSMSLRRDPELVKRCCEIATEWLIRYGRAFIEIVEPDAIYT